MHAASPHTGRRVVITGLGVVAPNGIGKEAFWQACVSGHSGLHTITHIDASTLSSHVAGEITQFDPLQLDLTSAEVSEQDRSTQFALAAANLAFTDAHMTLTAEQHERTGVTIGLALAYLEAGERQWVTMTGSGTHEPVYDTETPLPASLLMPHAAAHSIAAHHQLYGPCSTVATGCSAGADAIGQAFWTIQEDRADTMLAGGADAAISYSVLNSFDIMGALSSAYNAEPTRASRPYDGARDGFVMSEGAGMLVLEEREQALARGAHIYAEIITFSSNSNAHHMTALPPDGQPLQELLRQVLTDAEIDTYDIDYINSHGSSTILNEISETAAYKAVFGAHAYHIPISATKSMIGHTQGAASAIETIVTALALERQCIPPTINQEQLDPRCDLDYVPNVARNVKLRLALTHSSGFGGINSALLLARSDWIQTA